MSWSYDESALATNTTAGRMNAVRFLVGDTDTTDQQVQDEEILFAIAQTGTNVYRAAAYVAKTLGAKFARKVNIEIDGQIRAEYSDLHKHYDNLSKVLEYQAKTSGAVISMEAGGRSKSEMETARSDTDRVSSGIRRDMFDNPPDDDSNYLFDYD
tara:strand:- start:18 stop:482 length:465 start_codon:yes stop_codon:yes gene_type:complete